jgi:hypothetical protein
MTVAPSSIQLHLKPPQMGSIQVGISKDANGPVHVQVTADTAATLQKLQHDRVSLHKALSQSGIAPESGLKLTFVIGDPAPVTTRADKPRTADGTDLLSGGNGQGQAPPRRNRPRRQPEAVDDQPPETVVDITA